MRLSRRWVWWLISLGAALAIALVIFASIVPLRSDTLKAQIVATLSDRLNSDVTLEELSVKLFPRIHVEGRGLHIRQRARTDVPPLIAIKAFEVDADLAGVARKHVAHVEVAGLEISIPPKAEGDRPDFAKPDDNRDHRLHPSTGAVSTIGVAPDVKPHVDPASVEGGVVIDQLDTKDARLVIIPREADKEPRVWAIHTLRMRDVGVLQAMPFEATLTNGVPPGEIVTSGSFGPWNRDEPGDTPLEGTFTFDKADLGVFTGIDGTLSSRGSFGGALSYIDVHGETDTPDFIVQVGGHPFPLHTTYHAIVDGTTGDTRLERIDATFLRSTLTAKGAVLDGPPGQKGRTVSLEVTMPQARIEDVMLMAVNTPSPPMSGALKLTTKFLLPPGDNDVVERLRLNGRFTITHAKFTNYDVQGKIVELSYRGRGKADERRTEQVASDFEGRFIFGNGTLELPDVSFGVPGAQVKLAGVYAVKRESLAFKGNLLLDAKISQTVTGFKSVLLKVVDPFFRRRGGGSAIPIKIEGTRKDPKFGVDMGRIFRKGN
jgi:hypothetical protein